MVKKLIVLVVVLVLGAVGGYFGRPALDRATGAAGEVDAEIVDERREPDRLVLTLRMGEQTMLATFRNRTDDIAELVQPGDTITLRVHGTSVFADDAPILHVARPAPPPPEETDEVDAEGDEEGDDASDEADTEHEPAHPHDEGGALARAEHSPEAAAAPPPSVDPTPEDPVVDPGPPATRPRPHG